MLYLVFIPSFVPGISIFILYNVHCALCVICIYNYTVQSLTQSYAGRYNYHVWNSHDIFGWSHYKGYNPQMKLIPVNYITTSFNPQNLRNIIKKVAKISIIQILLLMSNLSVKITVFCYFLQLFRYPTNFARLR